MPTEFKPRSGHFILQEAPGTMSREAITIALGQVLDAGAVLGKITASGKYAEHDPSAQDGTETAAAILYSSVDATDADANGVGIMRLCEFKKDSLVWVDGIAAGDRSDALEALASQYLIAR